MGVIGLGLTLSRVGMAAFFLMLAAIFISFNGKIINSIERKFENTGLGKKRSSKKILGVINAVLIFAFIFTYVGMIYGTTVVLSKVDKRMADLFTFDMTSDSPVLHYADSLKLGERVAYWIAGWNVFNDHPMLGVGIGLAGYYMPENLNPYSRIMVEVRRILYRSDFLMNIKSMWIRILAETGIAGFCCYLVWLYLIFSSSKFLQKSENRTFRLVGKAGLFMLLALLFEGFSIDSFALPYLWVTAGLVTSTSVMAIKNPSLLSIGNDNE
jgi:O-antigen ligase